MPTEREEHESMSDDEVERLRKRIHNLNDTVSDHTVRLAEHTVLITALTGQLSGLLAQMATRDQLDRAMTSAKQQLEAAVEIMTLKMANLEDGLTPIRKGIYWTVGLIVGAVIVALLALVVKK